MSPLNAARRNRRDRRPALESLEGRQVLSTVQPFVGPLPQPTAQVQSLAGTTSRLVMTQTSNQTGSAFGLNWRSYFDAKIGQYRLDIQDTAGRGQSVLVMADGGTNISFLSSGTIVSGPSFASTARVQIRVFTNNTSLFGPEKDVEVIQAGVIKGVTKQAHTTTSNVSSPWGSIQLTYEYDAIGNTGTLTVHNINSHASPGNAPVYMYSKSYLNPDPGDPAPDSPSANPVQTIDFQMQGSGGSDNNGGINVFVPGKADAAITVVIDNSQAGGNGYAFKAGSGF